MALRSARLLPHLSLKFSCPASLLEAVIRSPTVFLSLSTQVHTSHPERAKCQFFCLMCIGVLLDVCYEPCL